MCGALYTRADVYALLYCNVLCTRARVSIGVLKVVECNPLGGKRFPIDSRVRATCTAGDDGGRAVRRRAAPPCVYLIFVHHFTHNFSNNSNSSSRGGARTAARVGNPPVRVLFYTYSTISPRVHEHLLRDRHRTRSRPRCGARARACV